MAQIKAFWRRFDGNHVQCNVADELVGQGGGPKRLSPEAEQAFLEDEVSYHREQMTLSAKLLAIAGARTIQHATA